MSISNLQIIGESINDSVPSTRGLFDVGDIEGIKELARLQVAGGASYIDVNVGGRSSEFFVTIIQEIQQAVQKPLSIDTPDPLMASAALSVYDDSAGKPILNSISPLRMSMFELYKVKPFRPILLISESVNGACRTAEETYDAARLMLDEARRAGIPNEDLIYDPGIAPIGSDSEGNLARLLTALKMIQANKDFEGVHASVGLSNFTVMLPPKRRVDGTPVKSPLESAFLTRAMPLGLDYVVGSVKRNYTTLPEDHPALICIDECLKTTGFESIMRVRKFYK
ncbi:MAG: dihydropteroate synthase [Planctomycetaceae bacterium]|jgi:5-methyltetrahydrofolate--homocysteine methyltransferase|nr:dihydropteroate synthase [Planctomycetaceae bacterium]